MMDFKTIFRDSPGSPVVETLPPNARGVGSIPGRGTEIPHASWPKHQNINNRSNIVNKFNKYLKKKIQPG